MTDSTAPGAAPPPGDAPAPRISAIIPAYNEAANIARAIASVKAQTCQDWELIVVDDGSRDDTVARATQAAGDDPRIRVVTKPNGGLSSARNAGVFLARGEWLMFHDADDWIHPRHFDILLGVARKSPQAGLVAGVCAGVDAKGEIQQIYHMMDLADPFPIFARTCAFSVHCILVKRDIVVAAHGFDENLRACEDWDLWQRIARQGVQFAQSTDVIAFYQRRPGSMSRDAHRMMEAISIVIRRAYGPDPRVAEPCQAYAQGKSGDDLQEALLSAISYNAGIGIGAGQSVDTLWDFALDLDRAPLDGRTIGELLIQGIDFGLAMTPQALAGRWDVLRPRIECFLTELARRSGAERQAETARAYAEARALGAAAFQTPWLGVHVAACTFDVGGDIAALDAHGRPLLVVAMHRHGRFLGAFEFPAAALCDPVQRGAVMGLAVRAWPTVQALKDTGALLRGAYWFSLAREVFAPHRLALLAGSGASPRARLASIRQRLGSAARRAHERLYDRRPRVPARGSPQGAPYASVLFYPQVSEDGAGRGASPAQVAAHLAMLRAEGVTCISDQDWLSAQENGLAPASRSAILAFDGAGVGPHSPVWATLTSAGAPALVFLSLTDGQPAGGWTWEDARRLQAQGVRFGSRPLGTAALSRLPLEDLQRQVRDIAALFRRELGETRPAVLFPSGDNERTVVLTFLGAGFGFGVWRSPGLAWLDGDALLQPSITVDGLEDLDDLARRLKPAHV